MTKPAVMTCIHGVDLMRECVGCALLALVMSRKVRRDTEPERG